MDFMDIVRLEELLKKQKDMNKVAMTCGERSVTYGQWCEKSKGICKILTEEYTDSSQNIGVFLPNSIEYAITYFGILFAKKTIIPVYIKSVQVELESIMQYCSINFLVTDTQNCEKVRNAIEKNGYKATIYCIDTDERIDVIGRLAPEKAENGSEVAIMLHTSGTTSDPKRVMLTHEGLLANVRSNISSLGLTSEDKVLIWIPMMFGYCNTAQFLTHLYLGASMVIMNEIFMPKKFFEVVQKEKITNFTCVPTNLIIILDYKHYGKYDISSLRYICFGGGKMPEEQLKVIQERFPNVGFVQTYGQTEASPRVTALLPQDSFRKLGSVGKPIPNVAVRIVNASGNDVEIGEVGEIIVSGKNVMKGYYRREEITRETIKNGWLYTGDLGYFDDEGYIYLAGRRKNMIITGGLNVYPEEIEEIISSFVNVKDVYVYGVPDEKLGESVEAKITIDDLNQDVDIYALKNYCSERLAQYKVPKKIIIVDELKKTYNGKIRRVNNL